MEVVCVVLITHKERDVYDVTFFKILQTTFKNSLPTAFNESWKNEREFKYHVDRMSKRKTSHKTWYIPG